MSVFAAYLDSTDVLVDKPRAVEVMLSENIDGIAVRLTGAMDLVRGDLTPVDFKSAASRPDPDQAAFDRELQLVCYQMLLEAACGETPPALELVYLVKTTVPQVVKVTAACSPPVNGSPLPSAAKSPTASSCSPSPCHSEPNSGTVFPFQLSAFSVSAFPPPPSPPDP